MKKKRTFTVMAILIAVLVLGIGYATVSNVTLYLNGTANINSNFDFDVEYDTTHTVVLSSSDTTTDSSSQSHPVVAGAYTDTTHATMTVWLDKDHQEVYAIYKVDNNSDEIDAVLTTSITSVSGANAVYFTEPTGVYYTDAACTDALGSEVLPHGQTAYLKVTIGLASTPLNDITGATFAVTTTAAPQETEIDQQP